MNKYESYYDKALRVLHIKWIAAIMAFGLCILISAGERLVFWGYKRNSQLNDSFSSEESMKFLEEYEEYKKKYPVIEVTNPSEFDLSVIVPCYNVEKYIEECIESILNQDTKYEFEIVIIDDGSTDKTSKILGKYENNQKINLIRKENGGIGAARNTGLRNSKGRYVMFVDSDDVLLQNTIEILLEESKEGRYDIVGGNYQYLFEDGRTSDVRYLSNKEYSINLEENQDFILKIDGVTCTKIYKLELWNQILFPEDIHFEDTVIRMSVFRKAKLYRHIPFIGYQYRKQNHSITYQVRNDYRSLHTLYVVDYLIELNRRAGLKNDDTFYKIVLIQLGKFCYPRMKELDVKILIEVLKVAKGIVLQLQECRPEKLPYELNILEQAILKEDLKGWKRISSIM